jgi:hypothetical protein
MQIAMAVESADNRGPVTANDSYENARKGAVGVRVSPSGAEPGEVPRDEAARL